MSEFKLIIIKFDEQSLSLQGKVYNWMENSLTEPFSFKIKKIISCIMNNFHAFLLFFAHLLMKIFHSIFQVEVYFLPVKLNTNMIRIKKEPSWFIYIILLYDDFYSHNHFFVKARVYKKKNGNK